MDIPIRTVGEYLRRWGFTPQRPAKSSYKQSSEAVARWITEDYPKISQVCKSEKGEIHWLDETGIRSDDYGGRSYSPRGDTPVRKVSGQRFSTNMISTVTNQGKLRFMLYDETLTGKVLVTFLGRLIRESKGKKIFLILDNHRVHNSKAVREWIDKKNEDHNREAEKLGQVRKKAPLIELFFLPTYAPQYNPTEYFNNDIKEKLRQGKTAKNKEELKKSTRGTGRKIQSNSSHVKAYFKHPKVVYAT
jgi:transposase